MGGGGARVDAAWDEVVGEALAWGQVAGVRWRDAAVLVPAAAHAAALRNAWARRGGWMPRIDTPLAMGADLSPPVPADAPGVGLDALADRLEARRRVRTAPGLPASIRRDARMLAMAGSHVATLACALVHAAASRRPAARPAFWEEVACRFATLSTAEPSTESQLARLALEWARNAPPWPVDALRAWRPGAWVIVTSGIADPLATALAADAGCPVLTIHLVPGAGATAGSPGAADGASRPAPMLPSVPDAGLEPDLEALCATAVVVAGAADDLEQEALWAAARVLQERAAGRVPVALVATDRLVVRRVHAMLANQGVAVHDASGWRLSTSRAGASVLAWLRALRPEATTDDGLDALKHLGADPGSHRTLESRWRRAGWRRLDQTGAAGHIADGGAVEARVAAAAGGPAGEDPGGGPAWAALREARATWSAWASSAHSAALEAWLHRLRRTLTACGLIEQLEQDEAGRVVLQALALDDPERLRDLGAAAQDESFGEREFLAWVDETLEASSFYPESGGAADVVIVPLSVMPMRPLAAVVMPGSDDRHLGAVPRPSPLLDDRMAEALGLPCRREAMLREAWAFAWAIAAPSVTVLWRRQDSGERFGPSPLVQRLALAHERAGRGPLPALSQPLQPRTLERRPQGRGEAVVRVPWPARLSATQAAALRECPYRFHVQVLLRLREVDELDEPPDRRVFGEWLHGVLDRLHREAPPGEPRPERVARLVGLGRAGLAALRCDPDEFALFEAGLVPFAHRYVEWCLQREAEGWIWHDGEVSLEAAPAACAPIVLHGRLDRIDRQAGEDRIAILDYKVTSSQRLRDRVRASAEDTQLLFYAALLRHSAPGPAHRRLPPQDEPDRWEAGYVALDDTQGVSLHGHERIGSDSEAYLAGLGNDLRRLRDGTPARALGEGAACEHCAARGVCRRDHARQSTWSAGA